MIARALGVLRDAIRNRQSKDCLPRFLTYTVTFGCNARCIMCDSWKLPTKDDLSLAEIERIFRQLPQMDVVRLTGGEPFARTDLRAIHDLAVKHLRPLVVHVTTNGFLTERITEFCESRDRRVSLQLLVSVDGIGDKHNQVRGTDRAWPSVIKTLESLSGRERQLRLRLMVNQTIVDEDGARQYRDLRKLLNRYGVRNNIVMAYDESATYSVTRDQDCAPAEIGQFTTFGSFSQASMEELFGQVEDDIKSLPYFERLAKRYYLQGIQNRLIKKVGTPNPKCVALSSHLRIFPNGDVPTCQFNSQVVGNLRVTPFSELWNSVRKHEQRAWVKACPGCWAECEVLPNAIYSLDLWRRAS